MSVNSHRFLFPHRCNVICCLIGLMLGPPPHSWLPHQSVVHVNRLYMTFVRSLITGMKMVTTYSPPQLKFRLLWSSRPSLRTGDSQRNEGIYYRGLQVLLKREEGERGCSYTCSLAGKYQLLKTKNE